MSPRWTITPSWKRTRPPGFLLPCLPVPVDRVPDGPDWLHEIKWDGYRIIARKDGRMSSCGRAPAETGAVPSRASLGPCGLASDEPDARRRGRHAPRGRNIRLLHAGGRPSSALSRPGVGWRTEIKGNPMHKPSPMHLSPAAERRRGAGACAGHRRCRTVGAACTADARRVRRGARRTATTRQGASPAKPSRSGVSSRRGSGRWPIELARLI